MFHDSHLPLSKWFYAIYLWGTEKKVSAKRLQRELGVAYETAWTMAHRIRIAARDQSVFCQQIARFYGELESDAGIGERAASQCLGEC